MFGQYPEDKQERIFRMAEADSTDESLRRDRAVDSQIKVQERGQWIQAGIFGSCVVGAFVLMGPHHSAWGVAFLSAPVAQAIGYLSGQLRANRQIPKK
jgi:hypothetical protein